MTSRFFKLVSFSLLLAFPLWAQTAAPEATPAPKKPKEGYFRFWNFLPEDQGSLSLVKSDGAADAKALLNAESYNFYSGYAPFPPARYHLKVVRSSAPELALETFDVVLRDDVYVTFAASSAGGKVKVEMTDDTYTLDTAPLGRLVIRQEQPGMKVVVTATIQRLTRTLNPGETQSLDGLPLGPVAFDMKAMRANGKTEFWSADVDFRKIRHASLLVVPDPYGRFRPRVAVDGRLGETESAPPVVAK